MRKLLSLVALSCVMAVAFGAFAPRANATLLPSGVVTLKVEQADAVQKAYYGCWWRDGYRHCGYRHRYWRHHYGWHHHYGWRHRYWRHRYYHRHHYWREGYDGDYDSGRYYHRRHYYYRSYDRPYYRGYGYGLYRNCIGLCWW
jgi:hypothetical protein